MKKTKNTKGRRKLLYDPSTRFYWFFQLGGSEEDACKWFCKEMRFSLPELDSGNAGIFVKNNSFNRTGLIWVGDKDSQDISVVSHEASHAVTHLCRVMKIDPLASEEFVATYHGYLIGEFLTLVNESSSLYKNKFRLPFKYKLK